MILDNDSLQVIKAITNMEESWTSTEMFMNEAKEKLRNFHKWKMHHVRRDTNVVAHVFTKNSLSISNVIVDMEDYPLCISSLI